MHKNFVFYTRALFITATKAFIVYAICIVIPFADFN